MTLQNVRRGMGRAVMVSLLSALAACSSLQKQDTESAQKAVREKVDARLTAADEALKQGQSQQAFEQLDQAIKIDPSAKQPWVRKAQIHFEARQYGNAINDAQEVLQRDVNDLTAQSILAVSGLRVSAEALSHLRKVNEVKGSTRNEAESVAKLIREALGEPILVAPQSDAATTPAKPVRRAVRRVTKDYCGRRPPVEVHILRLGGPRRGAPGRPRGDGRRRQIALLGHRVRRVPEAVG